MYEGTKIPDAFLSLNVSAIRIASSYNGNAVVKYFNVHKAFASDVSGATSMCVPVCPGHRAAYLAARVPLFYEP